MPQHPDPSAGLSAAHHLVTVPGGRVHLVEQGSGPLVLLVHGFPESWYAWRHQLPALAAAGFRAVAVDVRGYGRSSGPADVAGYRMTALVEENAAVVHALGERTAVIVGHDWGSPIAAASALLRPDVFTAVGLLGVPYAPRGGPRPSEAFAAIGGTEEFYVSYFQQPGRAEAEIEPDVRGWLAGFYTALSGDDAEPAEPADSTDPTGTAATAPGDGDAGLFFVPPGGRLRDRFPRPGPGGTPPRPSWLTAADLDVYAGEFERTGLTGALNRYRNADRDWEDLAGQDGAPVTQPSLFVAGALDASLTWMADAVRAHPTTLPGLVSSHILEGCGHWVQQERPEEVNRLLTDWLRSLPHAVPAALA